MLRCKQVWKNWEQLRCVAHSPLTVGMTIAKLFSLGAWIFPIQSVRVHFPCTERLQYLGRSEYQCPQCASVCQVRIVFLKIKQSPFSCRSAEDFTFLKRVHKQFKMLLEMAFVLASIVSTERKANLLMVIKKFLDPFMVVESVEPGCLFTRLLLRYKSTSKQ